MKFIYFLWHVCVDEMTSGDDGLKTNVNMDMEKDTEDRHVIVPIWISLSIYTWYIIPQTLATDSV